jgi:serine/threonine-protein kinase
MSPEQCRSATLVDQRSDIYALGCILFELVTGRTPFEGGLRELVERHQRAPIPRAKSFAPEISQELDDLIMLMLQKDPFARPQTMAAVQRKLQSLGAQPSAPAPVGETMMPVAAHLLAFAPTTPSPARQPRQPGAAISWARLRRAPIIAAAIAFVVAGALTAVAARRPRRSVILRSGLTGS